MLTFRQLAPGEPTRAFEERGLLRVPENGTLFGAFEDGLPCGLLVLSKDTVGERPVCAQVLDLYVSEALRRRQIGRTLLGMAAGTAVSRRIYFLCAKVTEESLAFWDAVGMRESPLAPEGMRLLDLANVEGLRHG